MVKATTTARSRRVGKKPVTPKGVKKKVTAPKSRKPAKGIKKLAGTVKAPLRGNKKGKTKAIVAAAEEGQQGMYSWNKKLPPELLLKIFAHLGREDLFHALLVCKDWNKLARDATLWTDVTLNGKKMTSTGASIIIRERTKLRRLRLVCWDEKIIDPILMELSKSAPNLEALLIDTKCHINGYTLMHTMQECKKITELHIKEMPNERNCHPLDCLPLEWNVSKLSLHIWDYIRCKAIDKSAVRKWETLREVVIQDTLCDDTFKIIISVAGDKLEKLRVDNLCWSDSYMMLSRCQLLRELYLTCSCHMNDASLLNGVGSLRNLEHLTISGSREVSAEAFTQFFSRQHVVGKLLTLHLSNTKLSSHHLLLIADNCPFLTRLVIKECQDISLEHLLSLVRKTRIIQLGIIDCSVQQCQRKEVIEKLTAIQPKLFIKF